MGKLNSKTGNKAPIPQATPSKTKRKTKKSNKTKEQTVVKNSQVPFENSPIYDLLQFFEKAPDQWTARYILILTAIILRSAVGLGSFLGQGEKPINGDFEAQRHWMELTIHLPIDKWYFYDPLYWGLDYPPLTAFHLYLFGKLGSLINSDWFKLFSSRGLESSDLKTYMRYTSLISELVIYIPALLGFISIMGKKLNLSRMYQIVISTIILCQPSLILIDHGHFQYNSVMLGLFLFSLVDLIKGNYILASIWFISSINFKQMGLYYAPFIFAYLFSKLFLNYNDLGSEKSLKKVMVSFNFKKLIAIGLAVIITSIVIISPFIILPSCARAEILNVLKQILIRVFPFERGLFEDKVANFWCTTNLVFKYRDIFSIDQLKKITLISTLVAILPPCLMISYKNIYNPKFSNSSLSPVKYLSLIYGFAATSWGFYLFSFLVHEKNVLVPLLPSTLLFIINDKDTISMIQWINNIAAFSLWPLLKKETLVLQYVVVILLSNWLVGGINLKLSNNIFFPRINMFWNLVISASYMAVAIVHFVDYFYLPPARYPDLWVILNTTVSFGCFSLFWLWILYQFYKL